MADSRDSLWMDMLPSDNQLDSDSFLAFDPVSSVSLPGSPSLDSNKFVRNLLAMDDLETLLPNLDTDAAASMPQPEPAPAPAPATAPAPAPTPAMALSLPPSPSPLPSASLSLLPLLPGKPLTFEEVEATEAGRPAMLGDLPPPAEPLTLEEGKTPRRNAAKRRLKQKIATEHDEEHFKKMATKAERARRSRIKKKAYMQGLEEKLRRYTEQLRILQLQDARMKQRRQQRKARRRQMKEPGPEERQEQGQEAEAEPSGGAAVEKDVVADEHEHVCASVEGCLIGLRQEKCKVLAQLKRLDEEGRLAAAAEARRWWDAPVTDEVLQTEEKAAVLLRDLMLNSRERQSRCESYLDAALDCCVPGQQAKFGMWLLSRDAYFYQNEGMWQSLRAQLSVTDEQMALLKQKKTMLGDYMQSLANVRARTQTLRQVIRSMHSSLNLQMEQLTQVLTPVQAARICCWVEKQTWCMEMLSSLFNKYVSSSLEADSQEVSHDNAALT